MRIKVVAPLNPYSGYGNDGIGLVRALVERDHDVTVEPTAFRAPIPYPVLSTFLEEPLGSYDLEIHYLPPIGARPTSDNHPTVLWTMLEDPESPFLSQINSNALSQYNYEHLVLTTEEAKSALSLDRDDVHILQGGVNINQFYQRDEGNKESQNYPARDSLSNSSDTFVFGAVSSLGPRKRLGILISAFQELQEEKDSFNAELQIHLQGPGSFHALPSNVFIDTRPLTQRGLQEFYWNLDCLVSPSEFEGKGMVPMEAALCGTPILVSQNAGHKSWLHPTLTPTFKLDGRGLENLKEAMYTMYQNRRVNFHNTPALANYLRRNFSWSKRVQKLGSMLGYQL